MAAKRGRAENGNGPKAAVYHYCRQCSHLGNTSEALAYSLHNATLTITLNLTYNRTLTLLTLTLTCNGPFAIKIIAAPTRQHGTVKAQYCTRLCFDSSLISDAVTFF